MKKQPEFEVKSNANDWSFDEEKEEAVVERSKEPTWIEIIEKITEINKVNKFYVVSQNLTIPQRVPL